MYVQSCISAIYMYNITSLVTGTYFEGLQFLFLIACSNVQQILKQMINLFTDCKNVTKITGMQDVLSSYKRADILTTCNC